MSRWAVDGAFVENKRSEQQPLFGIQADDAELLRRRGVRIERRRARSRQHVVGCDGELFVDEFPHQGLCHCRQVWDAVEVNARESAITHWRVWGAPHCRRSSELVVSTP